MYGSINEPYHSSGTPYTSNSVHDRGTIPSLITQHPTESRFLVVTVRKRCRRLSLGDIARTSPMAPSAWPSYEENKGAITGHPFRILRVQPLPMQKAQALGESQGRISYDCCTDSHIYRRVCKLRILVMHSCDLRRSFLA